ncbi:DUF7660 family protein [Streptomyces platensis]|uniref:DUF7660 family protein n=1 Tax=Streptomyces platensis TaxID=58346 RepID=UPI003D9E2841
MSLTPDYEVRSRDELVSFVRELRQDCLRRGHDGENQSLDRFLEALAAWMQDSPGWYQNIGKELRKVGTGPSWPERFRPPLSMSEMFASNGQAAWSQSR